MIIERRGHKESTEQSKSTERTESIEDAESIEEVELKARSRIDRKNNWNHSHLR